MADLGESPPPLFWVKLEESKGDRESKTVPPPPPLAQGLDRLRLRQKQKRLHSRGKNVENNKDSFEKLNIDVPSLEGTQKLNSPNIKVMSDLSLLFHEINLQYVVVGRQKAEFM